MRGADVEQGTLFSVVTLESRVPARWTGRTAPPGRNPSFDFHGQKRSNDTRASPSRNVTFLDICGVGVSECAPSQSVGVAVHGDGTYVAREFVFRDLYFDVVSVEVLRGPQGTYTGRNASAFSNVTIGNLGSKQIEGGSTFQLSNTLAARVSGQLESRDSAFTDLGPTATAGPVKYSNQPGKLEHFIGRAKLLHRPTNDIDLLLTHLYSDRKTDGLPTQSFAGTTVGNRDVAYDTDQALNTSFEPCEGCEATTGLRAGPVSTRLR